MEGIWLRFLSFQLYIMLLKLPRRWDCVSTELQHQERHGSQHYQGQFCPQGQFMMELEFRGIRPAASLPMRQLGSEVFTSPASDTERLVQGG
jgi:hypothetical protein